MTKQQKIEAQEEKQLLLQDLCARLPYGIKCTTKSLWNGIYTIVGYKDNKFFLDCPIYDESDDGWMIESIVPYLRPMSSMTEEEKETYHNLCYEEEREELEFGEWAARIHYHDTIDSIDYLNSIHIDYRDLIPKGLAIEAPKEMYNIKE